MSIESKLNKIQIEIDRGLKFKSADRLRNLLNEYPDEIVIWKKLGQLYYDSGFMDAAGKYWVFLEPVTDEIEQAQKIYLDSVNNSGTKVLNDIRYKGNKDNLPFYSKNRLIELEIDSKKKSNYVPKFKKKLNKVERRNLNNNKLESRDVITLSVFIAFIGFIVLCIIAGAYSIFNWIF